MPSQRAMGVLRDKIRAATDLVGESAELVEAVGERDRSPGQINL